jgi:hypothetical protein
MIHINAANPIIGYKSLYNPPGMVNPRILPVLGHTFTNFRKNVFIVAPFLSD